jgi:hypothetical protein
MEGFCPACLADTWDFDPGPLSPTSHLEWAATGRVCGACGAEVWVLRRMFLGFLAMGHDEYRVRHESGGRLVARAMLPPGHHEVAVSRCPRCKREMFNTMVRECPNCHVPLTALSSRP